MAVPLRKQQIAEIGQTYEKLNNLIATADALNLSPTTVGKYLKVLGLSRGQGGNQDTQRKISDAQLIEACKTMTHEEIAAKYGMHMGSLPRRFKKLGVVPVGYCRDGHSRSETIRKLWASGKYDQANMGHPRCGDSWHYVQSHDALIKEKHPGFIYIESRYCGNLKHIRLQCRKCGEVIERSNSTVRQKGVECDKCKYEKQREDQRARFTYFLRALKESKVPKTCKNCGDVFFSQYSNQVYCSPGCKAKHRRFRRDKRFAKYGTLVDQGVMLSKVMKRDQNICQLCGKPCDINDHTWGSFGPMYPTIDHIKALSNGGTHTFDNVQLAHAICNSYKRDLDDQKVIEEVIQYAKIQTA